MQGNGIDLIFPSKAIDNLKNLRGDQWEGLVSSFATLQPTSPEVAAFVLMMVRIGGCTSCQSDSFRAMRGCNQCSSTTIKRYKGSDQTLIELYIEAKKDVVKYINEV
jgi:hypothetical protein